MSNDKIKTGQVFVIKNSFTNFFFSNPKSAFRLIDKNDLSNLNVNDCLYIYQKLHATDEVWGMVKVQIVSRDPLSAAETKFHCVGGARSISFVVKDGTCNEAFQAINEESLIEIINSNLQVTEILPRGID